ncbi:unnamed protein product [Discula destructiva]
MASTRNPLSSDFILTPQQQSLLFAALNSNKQPPNSGGMSLSPASYNNSPQQNGFQESPLVDYDYDFQGDTSYDFSFADDSKTKMIGDLPGSNRSGSGSASRFGSDKGGSDTNDNEKRSHPDDEDDDDEGNAKRQETGEKIAKKPGRKPLTTEPTSKRKAQNRAAQRAFRERKEKHVKDLEVKVEELEKLSQSTTQENSELRAQVERMQVELSEYKKRLSLVSNTRNSHPSGSGTSRPTFGNAVIGNLNDVNFQFEFPKFGQLPRANPSHSTNGQTNARPSLSPGSARSPSDGVSPSDKTKVKKSPSQANGIDAQTKNDLAKFSGIFSPPLTDNVVASAAGGSARTQSVAAWSSSPSSSSNSNGGPSSSCGTSPEPTNNQSPTAFKPDNLGTIGEEYPSLGATNQDYGHLANMDYNNMSFLTNPNDFQFDPQLFGGYREPQQNVLSSALDDTFFNDAFDMDFTTPYFAPSPAVPKKDLMAQIDEAKNNDQTELVVTDDGQYLTCNKIWEKLQNCPKVQNGDFDLDGLCSDLQKKARCSGSGAVVDEKTFKDVMTKYLGKDGGECPNDVPPEALQAAQVKQAELARSLAS